MKTLMFILILACANFADAQIPLGAKATFGRFSANCIAGRGLCSFEIGDDVHGKTGKLSANTFVLKLLRAQLSEADQINITGKRFKDFVRGETMTFKQPEDLRIDTSTLLSLKIDPSYNNIAAGLYPLSLTADTVDIVFKLTATKK